MEQMNGMEWNGLRSDRSGLLDNTDDFAKLGAGILIKDEWFEKVFGYKYLSSRLLVTKFNCDVYSDYDCCICAMQQ